MFTYKESEQDCKIKTDNTKLKDDFFDVNENKFCVMNFRKFEVSGTTKVEALSTLADVFALNEDGNVKGDATQAYKLAKKKAQEAGKAWTSADDNAFFNNHLTKKKAIAGEAYVITVKPAVVNTRERPYTITDVKNEKGKRKFKSQYKWIDVETGAVVVQVDTTKADAKNAIKEMYTKKGYKGVAKCWLQKDVIEGEPVVAVAKYTPSVNATPGTYIVFGIAKD